jgi:hypothetical protein
VLSIGKLTVEQSRYYERQVAQGRDDYYSGRGESPGRWTGNAIDTLRLGRRVDDAGFMALMTVATPLPASVSSGLVGARRWPRLI